VDDTSRLLSTFLELVRIDSPSFEEREVSEYVGTRLRSLGLSTRRDGSGSKTGANTDNLLCQLGGDLSRPRILFAAHLDTVEPCRGVRPKVDGDVITSEGETVLGADDKVGIAVLIEVIEKMDSVYADLVRADRSGEDLRVHRVMKYASFFEELGLTR